MNFLLGLLLSVTLAVAKIPNLAVAKRPNILFILTDDQGKYLGGLDDMPQLQQHLVAKGATYPNHYCSVALCCPSRANLWTGRMPHNTNVTNVEPPYGGYPKVVEAGWNDNYLPLWMQAAGYNTYYVGKLWNAHSEKNYNKPYAKGFNGSDFLLDPWTYRYYQPRMTRNGEPPVNYAGHYSTDLLLEKSKGFLDEAFQHDEPWMLTVAPNAPHANGSHSPKPEKNWFGEPEYVPKFADYFKDYKVPRDPSFNKKIEGAVSWTQHLPELSQKEVDYIDEFQRSRLRALQSVDDMIGELVEKLDKAGQLDNTYIFYSTDNGYHLGQHRMQPGKNCGYETDIHIPLIVRGPGIPEGKTLDVVTSHTDLAPTFLKIANTEQPHLDGKAIPTTVEGAKNYYKKEHVAIEYWGQAVPEGIYGYASNQPNDPRNTYRKNTYKGVRIVSDQYSLYYSVWCTNEIEFFNLKDDPHQTVNMGAQPHKYKDYKIANRDLHQIIRRLDALMMVLKSCNGDQCRYPWHQLHPDGTVDTLAEALNKKYDKFYAHQPQVSYSRCDLGYHIDAEGPQKWHVYHGKHGRKFPWDYLFGWSV